MRALVQRVREAQVSVDEQIVGQTGTGLLVLVCAMEGDTEQVVAPFAGKIAKLRIFPDDAGKMNKSLLDTGGGALVVSQFTLAADTRRGNRPGFSGASHPDIGEPLYLAFAAALSDLGVPVETGQFGANMQVSLLNDGPVTIWLDSEAR